MGGSSILPATIHKNKLYFLFGKERKTDDTPGWSDFGGGIDKGETPFDTAIREGGEEMTGFLGDDNQIKHLLTKHGTYIVKYKPEERLGYHVHIFPMEYDEYLPYYYNNNQRFLQKKLDPKIISDSKIFEKAEIKWFSVEEIIKNKKKFRSFYQNIVDLILQHKVEINNFIRKHSNKTRTNRKTRTNKTI